MSSGIYDGTLCSSWGLPQSSVFATSDEEVQNLYQAVSCPVCQDFPITENVYSCQNDKHLICNNCASKVEYNCPACAPQVQLKLSKVAENCISNIVLPCKYKFQGCPQILRGEEARNHIRQCPYRPIKCFMGDCSELMNFTDFFEHLISQHPEKINGIMNTNSHLIEWWNSGNFLTSSRYPPFYLTCFNNVFLVMAISAATGTWHWVWILASDQEASRFQFESKVQSLDTRSGLQYRGPVHSIRKPLVEIVSSGQVFVTGIKQVGNPFIYRKGKGEDKTVYWRSRVTIHQVSPPIPSSFSYLETDEPNKHILSSPKDNWAYTIDNSCNVMSFTNRFLVDNRACSDVNVSSRRPTVYRRKSSEDVGVGRTASMFVNTSKSMHKRSFSLTSIESDYEAALKELNDDMEDLASESSFQTATRSEVRFFPFDEELFEDEYVAEDPTHPGEFSEVNQSEENSVSLNVVNQTKANSLRDVKERSSASSSRERTRSNAMEREIRTSSVAGATDDLLYDEEQKNISRNSESLSNESILDKTFSNSEVQRFGSDASADTDRFEIMENGVEEDFQRTRNDDFHRRSDIKEARIAKQPSISPQTNTTTPSHQTEASQDPNKSRDFYPGDTGKDNNK